MLMSPAPSSIGKRPAWSTLGSISSRIRFVRRNSATAGWSPHMPADRDQSGIDQSGEQRLIERYFKPLATTENAFGLGDDAAVITPPAGYDLVLTTDGVIAGVHFFADDSPQSIARKALRMNLSDLAAKGATPAGFLLSIALPTNTPESWIAAFAEGLGQDIAQYGCPLRGGDPHTTP